MLKDDADLSKLGLKEVCCHSIYYIKGQQIMMMGAIGELLKEPAEKAVFVEDMTDAEISKAVQYNSINLR
jgi:hypothetical protein